VNLIRWGNEKWESWVRRKWWRPWYESKKPRSPLERMAYVATLCCLDARDGWMN